MSDFLAFAPPEPGLPLQRWLLNELRAAMRDGRLPAGSRLPTSRALAEAHGISRSTVTAVYARLLADGYLVGEVGRGTFVAPQRRPSETPAAARPVIKPSLSGQGRTIAAAGAGLYGCTRLFPTFEPDQIDLALLPSNIWHTLAGRRTQPHEARLLQEGMPLQGYAPLRDALAEVLATTRGLRSCEPERLVIVPGVAPAIDLLARLLLDPGDRAWVEDPGPPNVQALLTAAGAEVVPLPVDEQGMRVDEGLRLAPRARLAHVTAGVQMPLGHGLSADRRWALQRWAEQAQAHVIVEQRDVDFVFGGAPEPELEDDERTIHLGHVTFNASPALRLAWLLLPQHLVDPVCAALALTGALPSVLDQAVLHDFIAQGHWARHLRLAREVYATRSALLREQLDKHFGRWIEVPAQQRGLTLALRLRSGEVSDVEIAARAAAAGIVVQPLSPFSRRQPPVNGLRLGFAAFPEAGIRGGVEKLVAALERRRTTSTGPNPRRRRSDDELFLQPLPTPKKYG
ncbi:PLP-dependent aminotransferase family protein [Pelomonas sp. KK5]|uniref:aminotransferase-like domain-containing protein n=1 Tax=Pelomonas sp. KK5 TaxID=1855730 RepID=UPI00097C2C86|nr:PLP-dependent aminotransferase family protein [Pelomonas sp. KK5]